MEFWRHTDQANFSTMFETAPIMMHSIGSDGSLLQVSKFWADELGYTQDEMVGRKSTEFLTPASREYAENEVIPEFFATGNVHSVPYQFMRRDNTIIDVLMSAVAQRAPDGTFIRSLAVMFDNTETKRASAMLHQKQRAESIGRLVGGVAHDFNNALSVIQGNLEMMQEDISQNDREMHLLDALRATRRAASMTRQLLSFEQEDYHRPKEIDVNAAIRDLQNVLTRLLPKNIEVEMLTNSGLWPVKLDRHQLDTALFNLASNARQAMPEGGKFCIETSNIRLKQEHVDAQKLPLKPGRYVMISASDTGIGIPQERLEQIFDPYFTTNSSGNSLGMGLSMVNGFVTHAGGIVRVSSETGFGSSFRMYFPATGKANRSDPFHDGLTPSEEEQGKARMEVLVVEDEDDVRKILTQQLSSQGFRVSEASNGDFALALLDTGYKPVVMLTDMVLPGRMQGAELVRQVRSKIPDVKVISISGHAQDRSLSGDAAPDVHLIKPATKNQLATAISNLVH